MRKSKIIEMLEAVKGNPEIKLWNGMVGDWMDISPELVPFDLVKMTKAYYIESCRLERCRDEKNWDYKHTPEELAELEKLYPKVNKWENNPYVTQKRIDDKSYDVKTVLILQAKVKGETSWDRLGDISY